MPMPMPMPAERFRASFEGHECDALAWFEVDALQEHTVPCVAAAIALGRPGLHYSDHGWKGASRCSSVS